MTHVALFPSVLGVRAGVTDAAERLRADGHEVRVLDPWDGEALDAYEPAMARMEARGYPQLLQWAVEQVADLPDGMVTAGFSAGGGMAEAVALHRRCSGVLLLAESLPAAVLGGSGWPAGTAVQVHHTAGDPFHEPDMLAALRAEVDAAGASLEVFVYPGEGHLFTDPSLPAEHDAEATALVWSRALPFVRSCG